MIQWSSNPGIGNSVANVWTLCWRSAILCCVLASLWRNSLKAFMCVEGRGWGWEDGEVIITPFPGLCTSTLYASYTVPLYCNGTLYQCIVSLVPRPRGEWPGDKANALYECTVPVGMQLCSITVQAVLLCAMVHGAIANPPPQLSDIYTNY